MCTQPSEMLSASVPSRSFKRRNSMSRSVSWVSSRHPRFSLTWSITAMFRQLPSDSSIWFQTAELQERVMRLCQLKQWRKMSDLSWESLMLLVPILTRLNHWISWLDALRNTLDKRKTSIYWMSTSALESSALLPLLLTQTWWEFHYWSKLSKKFIRTSSLSKKMMWLRSSRLISICRQT